MEAAEAKVLKVLEGSKQFLVPHYQRPYSWEPAHWETLWRDLIELLDDPDSKPHFLGSIVSSPARSVPEGVEKRLLIDGQQRLTTLLLLLTLIRDRARETGLPKLAERIQDLVTNRHEEGSDHFKLLPTQGEDPTDSDRETFTRLLQGATSGVSKSGIRTAYGYFDSKLRRKDAPELEALARAITTRLTLVSIILDERDNPHRIFESLNGKGRPLSQADLIRNYFFMRLPEPEHERVYVDLWRPMQRRLGEDALTDFVRHYLTRSGTVVREADVYSELKKMVDGDSAMSPLDHLKQLARFSEYYDALLHPEKATSSGIRERQKRLNRLEVTVAFPFLLSVLADHAAGKLTEEDVCALLDVIEAYAVRRFVAGVPTYGLNKVFAPLYVQATAGAKLVESVKRILATKGLPPDEVFREHLGAARLYGSGERREKTRFILERLDVALGHKERTDTSNLSIEHVIPQTLTDEWKAELGETWEEDHDEFLHTLGNLTLTSYNSELGNLPFGEKKQQFALSHIELNRYFESVERWTFAEVERRAEVLAELALAVWPYFGPERVAAAAADQSAVSVKGTVPSLVRVRDRSTVVQSWAEVGVMMMEGIWAIGEEEFRRVVSDLPRLVTFDVSSFRRSSRPRRLTNGAYVETNLSASSIHRLCVQAAQSAGLGSDEWEVVYEAIGIRRDDEEDGTVEPPTLIKQLQLEFWTEVKPALAATGKFPSLRSERPQYWYDVSVGRSNIHLSLTANVSEGRVSVKIVLHGDRADAVLEVLQRDREAIEAIVGATLEWNPYPEKRVKTIRLTREARIIDRKEWPAAIEWLTQTAVVFREAFAPRVVAL